MSLPSLSEPRVQARTVNGFAFAAMAWAYYYPRPYLLSASLLALMPVVALTLVKGSGGAVGFEAKKGAKGPNVAAALVGPGIVLALMVADQHILGWSGFWVPFAAVAALTSATLWYYLWVDMPRDIRKTAGSVAVTNLLCLAHSFGLVVLVNCALDGSVPVRHETTVYSRDVSHARRSSYRYHLTVGPWVDGTEDERIPVDRDTYFAHPDGSAVEIGVRDGFLGISWYSVR